MTNPQDINTKYPTIPFGQFQGIVEKLSYDEYREREIDLGNIPMSYEMWMELNIPYPPEVLADGQDKVFSRLMKPKSRLEVALTEDITDEQGREIKVYYLTDSLPFFNQDGEMDSYILEQVTYKGRKVHYSSKGEQAILEYLNRLNPAGLKYSVRA